MAPYDEKNQAYSWMPGFLRRFLNLDEPTSPGAGSARDSSYDRRDSYAPPRQTTSYTPAPAIERSVRSTSSESYSSDRYNPGITLPMPEASSSDVGYSAPAPREAGYGPRAPAPRMPRVDGAVTPGAYLPPLQTDETVQPIAYLLRTYARGALPPQGLEAFTRETRATTSDVWNFYNYWIRFQTDAFAQLGREFRDAVGGTTPASPSGSRRIKVTTANGERITPVVVTSDIPTAAGASSVFIATADTTVAQSADVAAAAADRLAESAGNLADDLRTSEL